MTVAPNFKKLIIPGKTDSQAPLYYARDMRTIEMWANGLQSGGGITEITSIDGSVTITDPTGPTVDLSVPPSGEIWHVTMGSPLYPSIGASLSGWGTDMILASNDQDVRVFSTGPIFANGGVVIEQTNVNVNPFAGTGTLTLNEGLIIVSDATLTNQVVLSISGKSLPLFGGSYTGWSGAVSAGTVLNIGGSQTTQLVTSTSNTTPLWVDFFYNVSSSGLG